MPPPWTYKGSAPQRRQRAQMAATDAKEQSPSIQRLQSQRAFRLTVRSSYVVAALLASIHGWAWGALSVFAVALIVDVWWHAWRRAAAENE